MVVSKISSNIHASHPILTQNSFFSGRYADFARQLTLCNFGVYAMDWIGNLIFIMYTFEILILHIIIFVSGLKLFRFIATGHGGSDGLHGYVPSLDQVVADTVSIFLLSVVV
jgi:acylglycerol lipase